MLPDLTLTAQQTIALSYIDTLEEADTEDQKNILRARRYYDGIQGTELTDRLEQFLKKEPGAEFCLNICRTVVNAVNERLILTRLETSEEPTNENEIDKPIQAWAWTVWDFNKMDAKQYEVHVGALSERESFLIVDWNGPAKMPRLTLHQRYTSTAADGDGDGVYMVYENDDPNQEPIAAVKQWTENIIEDDKNTVIQRRRTVYYANRVERYYYGDQGWAPYGEEGEDWPIKWIDTTGKPLGIAVIPFINTGYRPEHWDAIPMQDAINKSLIDLIAAGDLSAFRIYYASGFVPTQDGKPLAADGSNRLKVEPSTIIATSKPNATFKAIEGANPGPFIETIQSLILWVAAITDTPPTRFSTSKQVSAEGTLKQQSEPLMAKVRNRQTVFGNAWESAFNLAVKLANKYGTAGFDESVSFSAVWEVTEARETNLKEETEVKRLAGIPREQLWQELGYNEEQIATFKQSPEYIAYLNALSGELLISDEQPS